MQDDDTKISEDPQTSSQQIQQEAKVEPVENQTPNSSTPRDKNSFMKAMKKKRKSGPLAWIILILLIVGFFAFAYSNYTLSEHLPHVTESSINNLLPPSSTPNSQSGSVGTYNTDDASNDFARAKFIVTVEAVAPVVTASCAVLVVIILLGILGGIVGLRRDMEDLTDMLRSDDDK